MESFDKVVRFIVSAYIEIIVLPPIVTPASISIVIFLVSVTMTLDDWASISKVGILR